MKRIAIIGLGGIGGYLGTRLIKYLSSWPKDYQVVFIQRGKHLKEIQRKGLTYLTKNHRYNVFPAQATDKPTRGETFDWLIFCVKSYDLEQSANLMKKNLSPETVIISTLNGLNIAERLENIFPDKQILPGCIYLSARIEKPGVVRQIGGVGKFYFGSLKAKTCHLNDIETLLNKAKIKARFDADINTRLWEKFAFVCPLATLTSIYHQPIGAIIEKEETRIMLIELVEEIRLLAIEQGIGLPDRISQAVIERAEIIPYETKTSMQVDLESGQKSEIDIFTEYVVQKSLELGISLPGHQKAYEKLRIK